MKEGGWVGDVVGSCAGRERGGEGETGCGGEDGGTEGEEGRVMDLGRSSK